MFTEPELYDATTASFHDYESEELRLHETISRFIRSPRPTLLDAACGTGAHVPFLGRHFDVEGMDISAGMLAIARRRYPDVSFHNADMATFNLGKRYDVIICIGSSIGFVGTVGRLRDSIENFAQHIKQGGLLLIEPSAKPGQWRQGRLMTPVTITRRDYQVTRFAFTGACGSMASVGVHYLVGTPEGISHRVEQLKFGLFSDED